MSRSRYIVFLSLSFLLSLFAAPAFGQLGIALDVKKPKEFENRVLRSEKSDQKKFSTPKRFIQNTITHYNYFFNTNNKLNEVLDRAKTSFKDDYAELIPFYNYSLDVTAADSIQLDSISYKAQTGIVLHDLRNDWVDNLYLLWGASYYLKQQFDSAHLMFQFINYAFAEKEKDGYYKTIGSARDGNSAIAISTKEKNTLAKRVFSEPPSRNDAFIWQIRNHLAQDQFADASSLIQALKNDPRFPSRLHNDLEEVQAYYFYKQKNWDSAVVHLENALSNATRKFEKARWEFLLGQLYEITGRREAAEKWYNESVNHTTDPIMDVYARLAMVRVNKDSSADYIDKNIATLLKMAKRDKYLDYRDIIYYMAAQMELERDNIDGALPLLLKSTKYNTNNPSQRNKAFLQLADLSFIKRQYRQSYNFYDSLQLGDPNILNPQAIIERKTLLARLANSIEIVERQDSLQRVAAMGEDERKDFIKKLVRKLRKEQGLKDEGIVLKKFDSKQETVPSLFIDNDKKGEWYFYNKNSRDKGLADFESKWGRRQNNDNWRRLATQNAGIRPRPGHQPTAVNQAAGSDQPQEITYDLLFEKLPLTPEKIDLSNDSIQIALFETGLIYVKELEDCEGGTDTFEKLRERFPQFKKMSELLFNLYYCYNKNGETAKAIDIKKQMSEKYPGQLYTTIVTTGKNPIAKGPQSEATKTYEKIYDLFIEGNFTEALDLKKKADSSHGSSYWTPQLLYIEAVYHIRQRDDSTATVVLNNILRTFSSTPLAAKAETMLNVLRRRKEIEDELRNMVIVMPAEDSTASQPIKIIPRTVTQLPTKDTVTIKQLPQQPLVTNKPAVDSVSKQFFKQSSDPTAYSFEANVPYYVIIILNKIDPIFVNETKNAFARHNRDSYYNKQMLAELIEIDADNRLLLISPFQNAVEAITYVDQTKPKTATEIIPWLKGGKYSFSIITERNLEILKDSKDLEKYRLFLDKNLPGKF